MSKLINQSKYIFLLMLSLHLIINSGCEDDMSYLDSHMPKAQEVLITGNTEIGETLTGSYLFFDPDGDSEGNSEYRWLCSDTLGGEYTVIEGAQELSYTISVGDQNKYIKFEVIPVSVSEPVVGKPVASDATNLVPLFILPSVEKAVFFDEDMDEDKITGNLDITKAGDESNIQRYNIYWGSDIDEKLTDTDIIASFNANGNDMIYSFDERTTIPSGAKYFLILSENNTGESRSGYSLAIYDKAIYMLDEINSTGASYPEDFFPFNSEIYFSADNDGDRELYFIDQSGTITIFNEINLTGSSNPEYFASYLTRLYFAASDDTEREIFYISTEKTLEKATDVYSGGSSDPAELTVFSGKLFFSATDDGTDRELFYLDGLSDLNKVEINSVGSANPTDLIVYNNKLFFVATDSTSDRELFSYDLSEGIQKITDINTSGESGIHSLIIFNQRLYFAADDGTETELYSWDAANGTIKRTDFAFIDQIIHYPCVYKEQLFFSAMDEAGDVELWQFDETCGECLVYNINETGSSNPEYLTVFNSLLFFAATDEEGDIELWCYHKELGTQLAANLNETGSSYPQNLFATENHLIFSADDGLSGNELWVLYY